MTYLITGATGNVGGRVVTALIERGERPRILARDVEKAQKRFGDRVDIAVGDLTKPASVEKALQGIDALFLVSPEGPDLAKRDAAAAKAAKAAGVKRLVKLSALSASLPEGAGAALGQWHAKGEAAVRDSGLAWTFIQPGGFMSNALNWASSIKAEGVVRASTGEGAIAMVHPDDIAAVAAQVLTTGEYDGQILAITGPQALTYREMTAKIGLAIGKTLMFQPMTDEQARERLLKAGMPVPLADGLIALWRSVREGQITIVTDTVERVVGRKAIGFARWAQDNAAAFRWN